MKKKLTFKGTSVATFIVWALAHSVVLAEDKKEPPQDNIGNYRIEGIDVVQGRVFKKGMRHELSADFGFISNNTFLMYELAGAKYTFHLREGLAFEAGYWHAFSQEKSIVDDLQTIPCPPGVDFDGDGNVDSTCPVELKDKLEPIKNIFMGSVIWSPIYGKFSIFSKKIYHFDLFLTGGAGLFQTSGPNRFGFSVGLGSKIFLNDFLALRIDFRNFTVREGQPFNQISNNRLISLGLSGFFPIHPVRE